MLKQAEETDTVLLFIAGFGFNDGPDYDCDQCAEVADGVLRGSTVVQWQVLPSVEDVDCCRFILPSGPVYQQTLDHPVVRRTQPLPVAGF